MSLGIECITDFIFVENSLQKSDVILIPGSPHPPLMEKAAELYQKGFAPYILPSGGYTSVMAPNTSEWQYLNEVGIKHGVPQQAILKEDKAMNTFENAKYSKRVLAAAGIEVNNAIIVCKAFHSRRALLTYQTIFPENVNFYVITVEDRRKIRPDNWFLSQDKIDVVMNEVVKIGKYFKTEILKT